MTTIAPRTGPVRLALVIDLDTCVGCHACSIACKSGSTTAPFGDEVWPNQVFSYELDNGGAGRTLHVPRMCQHCETPDCVRVCPTGALFEKGAAVGEMHKERGFVKFIVNARKKREWVRVAPEDE